MMGTQNIKGTGLDFVYRWVSIEQVGDWCAQLRRGGPNEIRGALEALLTHSNYGMVDNALAARAVRALKLSQPGTWLSLGDLGERVLARLREEGKVLQVRGGTHGVAARNEVLTNVLEQLLDPLAARQRAGRARRIQEALVAGRISHSAAAREMLELTQQQKGGWLTGSRQGLDQLQ